jgi:hypothetical protein
MMQGRQALRVPQQGLLAGVDGGLELLLGAPRSPRLVHSWASSGRRAKACPQASEAVEALQREQDIAQVIAPVSIGRRAARGLVHQRQAFLVAAALVQQDTKVVLRRCMVFFHGEDEAIVSRPHPGGPLHDG